MERRSGHPAGEQLEENRMANDGNELRLTAYRLAETSMRLVPSEARRPWMDATPDGYANRCLPLLIANQSGWLLLNDATVRLRWDGGRAREGLTVSYEERPPRHAAISHFGSGIVTWTLPYLFRTPPGWSLVVRGATNNPRPDACPLDAVVETDWSHSPFTVNWQLLRRDEDVVVREGEPLCFLYPQRRGELESFRAEIVDVVEEPDLKRSVEAWSEARASFLGGLTVEGSPARQQGWQKDYFQGRTDAGRRPDHQTRLHLQPFRQTGSTSQ
jgi:hypothetical protein